jgi:hypothetical protein
MDSFSKLALYTQQIRDTTKGIWATRSPITIFSSERLPPADARGNTTAKTASQLAAVPPTPACPSISALMLAYGRRGWLQGSSNALDPRFRRPWPFTGQFEEIICKSREFAVAKASSQAQLLFTHLNIMTQTHVHVPLRDDVQRAEFIVAAAPAKSRGKHRPFYGRQATHSSTATQQITLSPHYSTHPSGNYTLPPARHPTPTLQTPSEA